MAERILCLVLQEIWNQTHQLVNSPILQAFPRSFQPESLAWLFCPSKMMLSKTPFLGDFLSIHTENTAEAWSQLLVCHLASHEVAGQGLQDTFSTHFIHGPGTDGFGKESSSSAPPVPWSPRWEGSHPIFAQIGADNIVAMSKPPLPSTVHWLLLEESSAPYGNPVCLGQQLWLQNSAGKGTDSALCWKHVVYWVGATHKSEYFPRLDSTADACLHLQLKRQI